MSVPLCGRCACHGAQSSNSKCTPPGKTLSRQKAFMIRARKILRSAYWPTRENRYSIIQVNREIYKYSNLKIQFVAVIKSTYTGIVGHVMRMDDVRTTNELLEGKPGGLTARWMDDVELGFRNMGLKRWRRRASERRETFTVHTVT